MGVLHLQKAATVLDSDSDVGLSEDCAASRVAWCFRELYVVSVWTRQIRLLRDVIRVRAVLETAH